MTDNKHNLDNVVDIDDVDYPIYIQDEDDTIREIDPDEIIDDEEEVQDFIYEDDEE